MIGEILTVIVLFLVVCMQYWLIISDRKSFREKEKELLNRLMARNFETFIQGEVATKERQQERILTPEEYLAKYGEEGLPVI